MESMSRLVLMASGNGSDAAVLQRAERAGVPAVHVGRRPDESRADYDARLADIVSGFDPDHVVLLGWMRILPMSFLGWFPGMVVNVHPALPGELPGTVAHACHAPNRRTPHAQQHPKGIHA